MGYKGPIEMIYDQMRIETENAICKAVQEAGINVDKEELIKALKYDREQYQKGYNDRDKEIVRCKDCAKCETKMVNKGNRMGNSEEKAWFCYGALRGWRVKPEWFCADSIRRKD